MTNITQAHYSNISKKSPEYTQGYKGKLETCTVVNGNREWSSIVRYVTDKRQAKQVCKELGYTPWNF